VRFEFLAGLILLACFFLVGCSSPRPPYDPEKDLVPVSGVVKFKNKPLANARITFVPAEPGSRASAGHTTTDANGNYEFKAMGRFAGALPGQYKVAASKKVPPGGKAPAVGVDPPVNLPPGTYGEVPEVAAGVETLPAAVWDITKSQTIVTVPAGGGKVDIDIK